MNRPMIARARWAVATIFFLNGFGFGNWVPRIPEVQQRIGLSEGQLGAVLLVMAIGALLSMPLAGALIVRLGSRSMTRLMIACYGLPLPLLALADGMLPLALVLFVFGALTGALDVSMNAQGVVVERRYGKPIMSSYHGMFSLGGMIGAGAAGLALALGVPAVWHLLAVTLTTTLIGLAAAQRLLPAAADEAGAGPSFARPTAPLLAFGILAFCALVGEGAIADWSAIYMTGTLNAAPAMGAWAFAAFSAMMAIGRFSGDAVVARLGSVAVVVGGGALAFLGLVIALLIGTPASGVVGFGMVGAGLSCIFPVVMSAAARTPGVTAGPALAAVATLGYFGFLVGPPTIGFAADAVGLRLALGLLLVLMGAIVILGWSVGRRDPAWRAPVAAAAD